MIAAPNPDTAQPPAAQLRALANRIKARYVSQDGAAVDYAGLRRGGLWGELEARLEDLRRLNPADWPQAEQRAFWINLYNVLVLHATVRVGAPGGNPLKQLRFFLARRWRVGGHALALDDIEHGILRGNRPNPALPFLRRFGPNDPRGGWVLPLEPRVHFALNCGARSCPPIGVYRAEGLEAQLELATASYLSAEVEAAGGVLRLPELLKWYQPDFGGREGLARLIEEHLNLRAADTLSLKWVYRKYDWTPNAA